MASNSTTITILPAQLRLVHIPLESFRSLMAPILECWWFRGDDDPFFALCRNGLEVSLFADQHIVRRTFGMYMDFDSDDSEDEDDTSEEDDDAFDEREELELEQQTNTPTPRSESDLEEEEEEAAGESGITLGGTRERRRKMKRLREKERRDEARLKGVSGSENEAGVKVGEDVWVALEISFHGDGWEDSGQRVRDISSPLAESGVSIMFLSTYGSDYILVAVDALENVTTILQQSGFNFTAADDEDDEDDSLLHSTSSLGRQNSLQRSSRGDSPRKSVTGGSLSGSLILSERGSASSKASSLSNTRPHTMSRSASTARAVAAATTSPRPAFSPRQLSSTLAPVPPMSPPSSAPTTPPTIDNTPLPTASTTTPQLSSKFHHDDSLSLLPDELVCIGLSSSHEPLWRTKIVNALFFPHLVLPLLPPPLSLRGFRSPSNATSFPAPGTTPTGSTLLSHSLLAGPSSTPGHPIPFIALTQTVEGASLTADVRLLRAVFDKTEEEEMVYAVGQGGLHGIWEGEEEDGRSEGSEGETDDDEEEDGEVEGGDVFGGKPPKMRRGRSGSGSKGESLGGGEEWEEVEREDEERERKERKEMAKMAGEGGRRLLKCLQLDLVSFGLDKHGIVEHFAGILNRVGINCLYESTFSSANILVSKRDIERAKRVLIENAAMP